MRRHVRRGEVCTEKPKRLGSPAWLTGESTSPYFSCMRGHPWCWAAPMCLATRGPAFLLALSRTLQALAAPTLEAPVVAREKTSAGQRASAARPGQMMRAR